MSSDSAPRREALYSTLMKALDGESLASNVHKHEEEWASAMGALPCPYPPEPLVRLYERSSALRPCVEAMTTNVHGFGVRLVPRLDLKAPDADQKIADIILAERVWRGEDDPADPTPAEIALRRKEIERGTKIEHIRLTSFLANCAEEGLIALRARLSTDYEVTGNAYLEVVRDTTGRIRRLYHCPAVNMRLRPLDPDPVWVRSYAWASDVELDVEDDQKFIRGFVQRVNGRDTYFKGFGDPRLISANDGGDYTGRGLPSNHRAATEVVHFAVPSGRTSYGVPRWIGATFEVLGIEAMSHVNYLGFDNKGIPPLAITVSGGTLTEESADMLREHIRTRIKGRMNYHAVLLLEALSDGQGNDRAQTRVAIQPLAQPQDAVFLEYADRSEDVVARQWRISPITRGKTKDFNKATSEAAMKKDEEQVFQPARQAFDEMFERTVLRDLGVRYHRVESNSPIASDAEALSRILEILVKNNIIDPNEARRVASKVMNEEFRERPEDWAKQPPAFTLAGIPLQTDMDADAALNALPAPAQAQANDVLTALQQVIALRERVVAQANQAAEDAEKRARADEAGVVEEFDDVIDGQRVHVVRMTPEAMAKLVKPHAANDGSEDEDEAA